MPSGHAVIDGSNLATEGNSEPSLKQLREAVVAFQTEYDFAHVTVIVDASFEHRVHSREKAAARAAIEANEFISPPAGVVGRGDRFILEVAERANGVVISNDSFQEFHAQYSWLLEEGRLLGGKPVPHVGWVFVPRLPVKGPVSRKARATAPPAAEGRSAKKAAKNLRSATNAVSTSPSAATTSGRGRQAATTPENDTKAPSRNRVAAWTAFRRKHPVGSPVTVSVASFVSHGAIGHCENALVYIPLALLSDPPPSRARDLLEIGVSYPMHVHQFDEQRRSIDVGLLPAREVAATTSAKKATARKAPAKKAAAKKATSTAPARKAAAKKATSTAPARKAAAKKAPAQKTPAQKTGTKTAPAKKAPAKKAPAKKPAAKRTTASAVRRGR